jgi:CRISPR-associated protein Cas2
MRCLLVYDISNDRLRNRVAEACLDYGLSRIQFSAFLGDLSRNHQEELLQKIRRRLGSLAHKNNNDESARVALFPLCETDFRCRIELGSR